MANKRAAHYVDDMKLYDVICTYKQVIKDNEAAGKPKPRIPEYAGKCIMQIANNLSSKHNFARYPFREEMIGDGVENCIKAFDNFDEVKYKKPFTYFTTIIYWAFVRRIEQEKVYLYTKYKLLEDAICQQTMNEVQGGDTSKASDSNVDIDTDKMSSFVVTFEAKQAKKKVPKQKKGIEKFVEDDVVVT
jgi:hypothetical protein